VSSESQVHKPVLMAQSLRFLGLQPGMVVLDGTLGAAGHATEFLKAIQPGGFLIGLDRDPQVAELAVRNLEAAGFARGSQFEVEVTRFSGFRKALERRRVAAPDRLFLDLGVCSLHLDEAKRGFSLRREGPLDMRLNPGEPGTRSAAEILATETESRLSWIFEKYGEERFARRVAREIVSARGREPLETTSQLRELVARSIPRKAWPPQVDVATRVFQALRIEANQELAELDEVLKQLPEIMKTGGRAGIISFHSLEDRPVKKAFREWAQGCVCPPELPICVCSNEPSIRILTPKPAVAETEEVEANPRSRSAKLRVAEWL